jgi:hypothetical protein
MSLAVHDMLHLSDHGTLLTALCLSASVSLPDVACLSVRRKLRGKLNNHQYKTAQDVNSDGTRARGAMHRVGTQDIVGRHVADSALHRPSYYQRTVMKDGRQAGSLEFGAGGEC